MGEQIGEPFDVRIGTVLRSLPNNQREELEHYRDQAYAGCEQLLKSWDGEAPTIEMVDRQDFLFERTEEYRTFIPSIINELVWTNLQSADKLDYPTPSPHLAMLVVKVADTSAEQIAHNLRCDKELLLAPTIGFVGLHNTILPPYSLRTRKADQSLETALDNWTNRFLRPVHRRHLLRQQAISP